jgi:hypothetical protein
MKVTFFIRCQKRGRIMLWSCLSGTGHLLFLDYFFFILAAICIETLREMPSLIAVTAY